VLMLRLSIATISREAESAVFINESVAFKFAKRGRDVSRESVLMRNFHEYCHLFWENFEGQGNVKS
jgi:hypothetical protein